MLKHIYRSLPVLAVATMFNLVGCSFAQSPTMSDADTPPVDDSGMVPMADSGPGTNSEDGGTTGTNPEPFRACDWDEGGRRPYQVTVEVLDNEEGALGTSTCAAGWDPYGLCLGADCMNVGTPGEDLNQIVQDSWHGGLDVGFRCGTSRWQESLPADTTAEQLGVRVLVTPTAESDEALDVSDNARTVWNGRYQVLRVQLCYQSS